MANPKKPAKQASKPEATEWGALPRITPAESAEYDRKMRASLAKDKAYEAGASQRAAVRAAGASAAAAKAAEAAKAAKLGRINLGNNQGLRSRVAERKRAEKML